MHGVIRWADDHQVLLYLVSMVVAALIGTAQPDVARPAGALINPVLALLLCLTFLGIPFVGGTRALWHGEFLLPLVTLNFAVVPAVVPAVVASQVAQVGAHRLGRRRAACARALRRDP